MVLDGGGETVKKFNLSIHTYLIILATSDFIMGFKIHSAHAGKVRIIAQYDPSVAVPASFFNPK